MASVPEFSADSPLALRSEQGMVAGQALAHHFTGRQSARGKTVRNSGVSGLGRRLKRYGAGPTSASQTTHLGMTLPVAATGG